MKFARTFTIGLLGLLLATAALASWYDDYDAGIAAARKGQWSVVIQKMTAAINGHPNEGDNEREYGAIFITYHPYYYRGVAYLNTGKYEQAIADLDKTKGPGEADLGPLGDLLRRAKSKLEAASTPEPQPQPQPVAPQPRVVPAPVPMPVQPAAPSIDPALRQQAAAAITQARTRLAAAQQRKAVNTPQYTQATQLLTDALTRSANPRSNDDLTNAIGAAQNAAQLADLAPAPGAPAPPPTAIPTRPAQASAVVLADPTRRVRDALESYFRGEFDDASVKFKTLSQEMPKNAWIWAFLGASQYSQYAFEADDTYKRDAMESFRKAKQLKRWNGGLSAKYFSKRIRKVFESAG
jgi:tetratricopeptide (TPR) repeat protein